MTPCQQTMGKTKRRVVCQRETRCKRISKTAVVRNVVLSLLADSKVRQQFQCQTFTLSPFQLTPRSSCCYRRSPSTCRPTSDCYTARLFPHTSEDTGHDCIITA